VLKASLNDTALKDGTFTLAGLTELIATTTAGISQVGVAATAIATADSRCPALETLGMFHVRFLASCVHPATTCSFPIPIIAELSSSSKPMQTSRTPPIAVPTRLRGAVEMWHSPMFPGAAETLPTVGRAERIHGLSRPMTVGKRAALPERGIALMPRSWYNG
jgi:hypothetical protein